MRMEASWMNSSSDLETEIEIEIDSECGQGRTVHLLRDGVARFDFDS